MGSTNPTPSSDEMHDSTADTLPDGVDLNPSDDGFEAAVRQAIIDAERDDAALDAMTDISEAKYTFTCVCTCKCTLSC